VAGQQEFVAPLIFIKKCPSGKVSHFQQFDHDDTL
jgi:hypothetical protein